MHKERMAENFNVFDFVLTDDDMSEIATLDKGESSFFSRYDPKMVELFAAMAEERKKNHDSRSEKRIGNAECNRIGKACGEERLRYRRRTKYFK